MNKINIWKIKQALKNPDENIKNIIGNNNINKRLFFNFCFIYNCKEEMTNEIMFYDKNYNQSNNDFFYILQDFEHEDGDCDCDFFDSDSNELDDNIFYPNEFSFFNKKPL